MVHNRPIPVGPDTHRLEQSMQGLTSTELLAVYGMTASYFNATRVATRIVKDYRLPWTREGNTWYTDDLFLWDKIRSQHG